MSNNDRPVQCITLPEESVAISGKDFDWLCQEQRYHVDLVERIDYAIDVLLDDARARDATLIELVVDILEGSVHRDPQAAQTQEDKP